MHRSSEHVYGNIILPCNLHADNEVQTINIKNSDAAISW